MKITIIEYDQASGHEGIHEMAMMFSAGWETLIPLRYYACCGVYRTTLYSSNAKAQGMETCDKS